MKINRHGRTKILTQYEIQLLFNEGFTLRVIQKISGHRTLDELYKYLEVRPEQVKGAIASLSMLTPVESESAATYFEKPHYPNSARFLNKL